MRGKTPVGLAWPIVQPLRIDLAGTGTSTDDSAGRGAQQIIGTMSPDVITAHGDTGGATLADGGTRP